MTYKAILIDLDGVIRLWPDADRLIEDEYGLPVGSIRAGAFAEHLVAPATSGIIADDVWRRKIVLELAEKYPQADCEAAVRKWSDSSGVIDHELLDILGQYRPARNIVLVTNATTRLTVDLAHHDIIDKFNTIVNSSDIGHVKPEHLFFEIALSSSGFNADEVLYIDDSVKNIQAGCELRMMTHLYSEKNLFKQFLQEHLDV